MSVSDQLLPASFRGVSFYVSDSSMNSGRKQVTHEFPNSDRRYVEDLGRYQNVYKMTAIINGTDFDYLRKRNALIDALEKNGSGLLVHPFYGTISVIPKQYTVREAIRDLGNAVFDLTFEKGIEGLTPIAEVNNLSNIGLLADKSLAETAAYIGEFFSLYGNYANNFADAQNMIGSISNAFDSNTSRVTQDPGIINNFNRLLTSYGNSKNQLLNNPEDLGTQTMNLYKQTDLLITDPKVKSKVYKQFYNFNDNQNKVPPTTYARIQRQNNRDVLNSSIKTGALVQSYRNAALSDYDNINKLNATQSSLEEQYNTVINDPVLSDTVKNTLTDLRNVSRKFFTNEKLNTSRVSSIKTNITPLTALAYRYYGNLDNVEKLAGLNSIKDTGFVSGVVDILTG